MDCRNEVPAESAARMASNTSAGVTVIGSLWMVSPAAVARLATISSSSWLGLPMPMSANVVGRPTLIRKCQNFLDHGFWLRLKHELSDEPERYFFAVHVSMGTCCGSETVVDGMGGGKPGRLKT